MKPFAVIGSDQELHRALRAWVAARNISYDSIDEAAGFTAHYTSKLLAPRPMRNFSSMTRWALVEAVGLRLVLVPDPAPRPCVAARLRVRRKGNDAMQSVRLAEPPSRKFMRSIGRLGGMNSLGAASAAVKRRIAKAGAAARWGRG